MAVIEYIALSFRPAEQMSREGGNEFSVLTIRLQHIARFGKENANATEYSRSRESLVLMEALSSGVTSLDFSKS